MYCKVLVCQLRIYLICFPHRVLQETSVPRKYAMIDSTLRTIRLTPSRHPGTILEKFALFRNRLYSACVVPALPFVSGYWLSLSISIIIHIKLRVIYHNGISFLTPKAIFNLGIILKSIYIYIYCYIHNMYLLFQEICIIDCFLKHELH